MKNKKNFFLKKVIGVVFFLLISAPLLSQAQATPETTATNTSNTSNSVKRSDQTFAFVAGSGYTGSEIGSIVAGAVEVALGFLGVIFLALIVFSGYQWMMAGGNEEQVKKATGRIKNAVIGVIIVVLAYSITALVFKALPGAGGGTTPGGSTGTQGK